MSRQQLKEKGFTIIEVVLVLAIAALIFLMVFIALPALQRTQRDDSRKKDVTLVSTAIQSWQGNNRSGDIDTKKLAEYIDPAKGDTSSSTTTIEVLSYSADLVTAKDSTVSVYKGAKCSGTVGTEGSVTISKGSSRQYAIVTRLESGTNSGFCLDS